MIIVKDNKVYIKDGDCFRVATIQEMAAEIIRLTNMIKDIRYAFDVIFNKMP